MPRTTLLKRYKRSLSVGVTVGAVLLGAVAVTAVTRPLLAATSPAASADRRVGAAGAAPGQASTASESAAAAPGAAAAAPGTAASRYLKPGAGGTTCVKADPCGKLSQLFAVVQSGDVVELAAGHYPAEKIVAVKRTDAFTKPVVIRPAAGAKAVLDGYTNAARWHLTVSNVVFQDLAIEGVVDPANRSRQYGMDVEYGSSNVTFERITTRRAGFWLSGRNITVRDSHVVGDYAPCPTDIGCGQDGITVGGSSQGASDGILIENTEVEKFAEGAQAGFHADCIQVYDANNVTIRRNNLHDCYNSAIIFSGGQNKGTANPVIQNNFLSGCKVVPKQSGYCKGGATVDIRNKLTTNMTFTNNTVSGSFLRAKTAFSGVYANNILGYVSEPKVGDNGFCNLYLNWNKGLAGTPVMDPCSKTGTQPTFVTGSASTVDLHVADFTNLRFANKKYLPAGGDIDGQAWCSSPAVGADESATCT